MSYESDVQDIYVIQTGLSELFSNARGWGGDASVDLLEAANLDLMPSLAKALLHWPTNSDLSPGELVLAWANLGSIQESSLRLFLAVYLTDFQDDAELLASLKATYDGQLANPGNIAMEKMRQYIGKRKLFTAEDRRMIHIVQMRRNAIHSFAKKELGSPIEFASAVRWYRTFIARIATTLPSPDGLSFPWLGLAGSITVRAALSTPSTDDEF